MPVSFRAAAIEAVRLLWSAYCDQYYLEHGDAGTCVLGAGIEDVATGQMLIRVSSVTRAQGSLVWEHSVRKILEVLASFGISARYNPGVMD